MLGNCNNNLDVRVSESPHFNKVNKPNLSCDETAAPSNIVDAYIYISLQYFQLGNVLHTCIRYEIFKDHAMSNNCSLLLRFV